MKMNVNDTKFLNKEQDIKHKDVVTITNEGMWENSQTFKREDGSPQQQFKINIRLANGEERSTSLNWTNIKLLVSAFGDDSESWVGKQVRAWKTKSEKAKAGYIFVFVPIDWDRDDTGEWIIPPKDSIDDFDHTEDPNLDDIPY